MHAPELQKMEGSWRGLQYLVANTETGTMLKIKVMNVSKKDILKDFTKQNDWEQATIFKKIYEEEYGTLGGQPYACLIGDYEITRHPEDIQLLTNMSNVAAAAHAPFLTAASPALFNWDSFTELAGPRDVAKIFDNDAYLKWKDFRKSDDSKYVGMCMPHVLMRLPYGKETAPVEEFDYEEKVDGRDHKKYLWGNAAYALGARITDAFAKHEWCAAIRGVEGGGLVEGLPSHYFPDRRWRPNCEMSRLKSPSRIAGKRSSPNSGLSRSVTTRAPPMRYLWRPSPPIRPLSISTRTPTPMRAYRLNCSIFLPSRVSPTS